MKRALALAALLTSLTACSLPYPFEKEGVKCDNEEAVQLLEEVLNRKIFHGKASIEVDRDNIVEWDYKSKRYLCKAKIKGDLDEDMAIDKSLALTATYGFRVIGDSVDGWVFYITYIPTSEWKKAKEEKFVRFYVEVMPLNRIYTW